MPNLVMSFILPPIFEWHLVCLKNICCKVEVWETVKVS